MKSSSALGGQLPCASVLDQVLQRLSQAYPRAAIGLLAHDARLGRLDLVAALRYPASLALSQCQDPVHQLGSPAALAVQSAQPVWMDRRQLHEQAPELARRGHLLGLTTTWSCPVMAGEQVLGCLDLHHRDATAPTPEDWALLRTVGGFAATALQASVAGESAPVHAAKQPPLPGWDILPGAVLLVDPHGSIVQATTAAHQLLGWPAAALPGRTMAQILPEWIGAGADDVADATRAPDPGTQDIDARTAQGRRLRLSVQAASWHPAGQAGGHDEWTVLSLTDRSTEWQLNGKLLMQARMINRAPDSVLVIDDQHTVVAWNEASARLFGVSTQEAVGKLLDEVLPVPDRTRLHKALGWLAQGAIAEVSVPLVLECDAQTTDVLATLVRLPGVPGVQPCTVMYTVDVSALRRTEDDMHAALERAHAQGERLMRLGRFSIDVAREAGAETLHQTLVDQARHVLDAECAELIEQFDDHHVPRQHRSTHTPADGPWPWETVPARELLDTAMAEARPVLVAARSGSAQDRAARSWLAVPILEGQRPAGLLRLMAPAGREWSQDDLAIAQQLAQFTGSMLSSAALYRRVRQAESRLQAQLQFTTAITDSLAEGVAVVTDQGRVSFTNPSLRELLGWPAHAVPARGLDALMLDGQPLSQCIRDVFTHGQQVIDAEGELTQAGLPRHLSCSVAPLQQPGAEHAAVLVVRDVTEQRRLQQERERSITHDLLTGLPNRLLVQDRLLQALALSRRTDAHVAVVVVDLDDFRSINEVFGFDEGDQVLRALAQRLSAQLRDGDTLGRLGADAFVLLLPQTVSLEDAMARAQTLHDALAAPLPLPERELLVTCSFGVTVSGLVPQADRVPSGQPVSSDAAVNLLKQADVAVSAAKRAGRGQVRAYTQDLEDGVAQRLQLRNELRQAIAAGEFTLLFQPQFDLAAGRLCGIEALVRWQHPQHGLLEPGRFLPLAEESGQVVAIGRWVLEQACRANQAWMARGTLDVPVAVNIAASQFHRPEFIDEVQEVLQSTGLPGHRLVLELTESTLADPSSETLARMNRLRELGVAVSIDDFGTGLSRLSNLRNCPVDRVKIDPSFVRSITTDGDDSSITLSIIAIAHHLKLRVIAEGVETPAQVAYLRRHLCDEVQGHAVGRPMSGADLEHFAVHHDEVRALLHSGPGDERPVLLLVDDEPNVLRALTRTLRRDGYRLLTADSAQAAFELLAQHRVDVIVSDQRMPGMSGTEFLGQVKTMHPDTVRVILSGYTDLQTVTEAINQGSIYRFLTKPWEDDQLRAHLREALQHSRRLRQSTAGAA